MKNMLLHFTLSVGFIYFFFSTHAQESKPFVCALDNFITIAREQDSDYDKKMIENEKLREQWNHNNYNKQNILTIPVVVHVVWNNNQDSISDTQVLSQIDILNLDYMKLNADTSNTPLEFSQISDNPKIQFCLAQTDPNGNLTNGITRTQTSKTVFALVSGDTSIWHTSLGGYDGWDPTKYLNIWVADISPAGGIGFWPGAIFAGHREGVVINYTFFGTTGSAVAPYNLGRTTTHEIGHYLDLHHLWGDAQVNSSCSAGDYCNDTPAQRTASQNCPNFPLTDICTNTSPGLNFMNFMDYPRDNCKNMFTTDQVARMRNCLQGIRSSLFSSQTCSVPVGINNISEKNVLHLFPNPATNKLTITNNGEETTILVYNSIGKLIMEKEIGQTLSIDVSSWSKGIYILVDDNKIGKTFYKVVISE